MPRRLFKERHELPTRESRHPAIPPNIQIMQNPGHFESMSDALKEFIEPYRDLAKTNEAMRKLLSMGLVAWNAAILPEQEGQALIDDTIASLSDVTSRQDQADLRELFNKMIQRKQEYFADNRRMMISFEVIDTGQGYRLNVLSTLDDPRPR
jgi:hypothetical protein